MAVVEKKPEVRSPSALNRLAVASLVGVVYVLGSLAVAFKAVPALCRLVGLTPDLTFAPLLIGVLALSTLGVLAVFGFRLMGGTHSRLGLRAGIFLGLVFLFIWALFSRWIGGIIEGSSIDGWLSGMSPTVSAAIAGVLSLLFGYWLLRIFLRPTFESRMVRFEEAGWFGFKTYKPGQGVRVRRGTILGVILLAVSGIWVMLNHRILERGSYDWSLNIPFTGSVAIDDAGDALRTGELTDDQSSSLRIVSAGVATDVLTPNEIVERSVVIDVLTPLAQKKRASLKELIDYLRVRKDDLSKRIAAQPDEKERLPLKEEEGRLQTWIEQLQLFDPDLAPAADGQPNEKLFLLQKELDRFLTLEQDKERVRKSIGANRDSLREEMDRIAKWVREEPLPVAARVLTRYQVREINARLDPTVYRVVEDPATFQDLPEDLRAKFQKDRLVNSSDFAKAVVALEAARTTDEEKKRASDDARKAAPEARPVKGETHYASLTLLPAVRYTLPLLLLVLAIWVAWRIVNLPVFADFLISTEAEMNKVSWTTRQRLFQDTVVVLVTMVLMAVFLFLVDIAWAKLLSSRPIGVLQVIDKDEKASKKLENLKW